MRDWIAVFAVALVIIVGSVAGLAGTVAFLLALLIAWYLFTARELGFAGTRAMFDIELAPPLWQARNWRWLNQLFDDFDRLVKATTAALAVVIATQMFRTEAVVAAGAVLALLYALDIRRSKTPPQPPPRLARVPDAGAEPASSPGSAATAPTSDAPVARVAPPVRPTAIGPLMLYKPMPLRRRALASTAAIAKRPKVKPGSKPALKPEAKRPSPTPASLARARPGTPAASKARKPLRRKPALRRPAMRTPSPLLFRAAARLPRAARG